MQFNKDLTQIFMRKAKNTPLAAMWFRFSARRANGDIFPPPPLLPPGGPSPCGSWGRGQEARLAHLERGSEDPPALRPQPKDFQIWRGLCSPLCAPSSLLCACMERGLVALWKVCFKMPPYVGAAR